MKFQSLFSGKSKKNIVSLLSADFAQRVIKIKPRSFLFSETPDFLQKKACS